MVGRVKVKGLAQARSAGPVAEAGRLLSTPVPQQSTHFSRPG